MTSVWRAVSRRVTETAEVSSRVRAVPVSETTVRKRRSAVQRGGARRLCGLGGAEVDGEEAAGDVDAGAVDGDAGAADGVVEVDVGGVGGEGEGEGFELLVEGGGGVVAGAGDAAAVEVDGGEGLEDVVELGGGEVDGDGLVAEDAAGVLEEADAVFVEGDAGDGEGGGGRGLGTGLGAGLELGGGGGREEGQEDGGSDAHGCFSLGLDYRPLWGGICSRDEWICLRGRWGGVFPRQLR